MGVGILSQSSHCKLSRDRNGNCFIVVVSKELQKPIVDFDGDSVGSRTTWYDEQTYRRNERTFSAADFRALSIAFTLALYRRMSTEKQIATVD